MYTQGEGGEREKDFHTFIISNFMNLSKQFICQAWLEDSNENIKFSGWQYCQIPSKAKLNFLWRNHFKFSRENSKEPVLN